MNEKMLFDQFEFARIITLKVAEGITKVAGISCEWKRETLYGQFGKQY